MRACSKALPASSMRPASVYRRPRVVHAWTYLGSRTRARHRAASCCATPSATSPRAAQSRGSVGSRRRAPRRTRAACALRLALPGLLSPAASRRWASRCREAAALPQEAAAPAPPGLRCTALAYARRASRTLAARALQASSGAPSCGRWAAEGVVRWCMRWQSPRVCHAAGLLGHSAAARAAHLAPECRACAAARGAPTRRSAEPCRRLQRARPSSATTCELSCWRAALKCR
mmetsp:Transcript_25715/g.71960  ORF Transcript_25715/g.71960 Transcript_25715/m.71960 type:complete len:232 (+) Transcript_25715:363-1058(+)